MREVRISEAGRSGADISEVRMSEARKSET